MKCKKCNIEMHLDDVDFNFKGNKDNYWYCKECSLTCIEKIRYGKSIKQNWLEKED